jgi:hypothetical protein
MNLDMDPKARGEGNNRKIIPIKTVIICMIISVITVVAYDRLFAQKIVAIDTTEYLQKVQSEYLKGKMTDDDMNTQLEVLREMIKKQPRNRILIVSDMVVSKNVETLKP